MAANIIIDFLEKLETIEETINFLYELCPDDIGYFLATPCPRTPLIYRHKNGLGQSNGEEQV